MYMLSTRNCYSKDELILIAFPRQCVCTSYQDLFTLKATTHRILTLRNRLTFKWHWKIISRVYLILCEFIYNCTCFWYAIAFLQTSLFWWRSVGNAYVKVTGCVFIESDYLPHLDSWKEAGFWVALVLEQSWPPDCTTKEVFEAVKMARRVPGSSRLGKCVPQRCSFGSRGQPAWSVVSPRFHL